MEQGVCIEMVLNWVVIQCAVMWNDCDVYLVSTLSGIGPVLNPFTATGRKFRLHGALS